MAALRSTIASLTCICLFSASVSATESQLADAAEQDSSARVGELLSQGQSVRAVQADGMTALHWAAYHENLVIARQLLKANADPKAVNRYGVSPLLLACMNGNSELVELLLNAGADPNASLPGGETALMTAARTGRVGAVTALLARKAAVNAREHKGQTALMWAAAEGHVDVVDALLNAGAEFRKPLPSGFTPLFFAVRQGHLAVVARLLAAGENVNAPMRPVRGGKAVTPLMLAVENGHFELAAELLKAGADPNDQSAGYAALHAITWVRKPIRGDGDPPPAGSGDLSSLELVRRLLKQGADINVRVKKGESGRGRFTTAGSTPFLLAARACDVPLMQLLVEFQADTTLTNTDNSSPLLAAAGVGALGDGDEAAGNEEESIETVKVLLDLGADINALDDNGETAMHGAAYQSRHRLVALLAQRGANVEVWNRKNKWNWTPLMIAEGHRPGNFRPDPSTIEAIKQAMDVARHRPDAKR